jgi:tetratricopeptide (TPR) repeat protein
MGRYDEAIRPYEQCLQVGVEADNYRVINNGLCNLGRAYEGLGDIEKAKKYYKEAVDTPRPPEAYWIDTEEFRFSGDYLLAKLAVKEKNWEEARKQLMAVIGRCETLRKSIQDSPIKITFNDTQRKPFQLLQHVMLEEGKEMEALAVAEKGRGRDFFDKTEGDFCTQLDSVDVLLNTIKSRSIAVLFISALEEVGKLCLWFISSEGKLLKQCLIPSTECKNLFTLLRGALYRTQGRHEIEFKGTTNEECSIINKAIELVKQLDSTRTNDHNPEKPQNNDNSEKAGKNDDNSEKPQNNNDNSEKPQSNDDNSEKARKHDDDSEKPQNNDDHSGKAGKNDDNSEKPQNNDDNSKRSRHNDDNLEKNQKSNKMVDKSVDETGDEGASYSTNESRELGSASQSQPPSQGPSSETIYSLSELIDQLSELILVPLKDELESLINKSPADETSRLLIIPQGTTFNIPFSALKLNSKRLCEQLTIIEAFSLHSFAYSTTESEKNVEPRDFSNALIVGNPTNRDNLPQAEVEAKSIAKILGATPLIGREATKKAVMERLPNASLVHFACHGELEGKALVLAQSCPTR